MADMKYRGFAQGFTVIELMLFLAITGALFVALMFGVNTNITQERYREGVQSYSALLQNQYSEVMNTRNDRNDEWQCTNGTVTQQPNGEPRGASKCVILGRAVQIQESGTDGTVVKTAPVIGVETQLQNTASDLDTLIAYHPKMADTLDVTMTTLDWGAKLISATDRRPSTASFLILRSPVSGLVRVFASSSELPSDLSTMIIAANTQKPGVKNCVAGDRGLLPSQSVTVDPSIAGPDGVIVNEDDDAC